MSENDTQPTTDENGIPTLPPMNKGDLRWFRFERIFYGLSYWAGYFIVGGLVYSHRNPEQFNLWMIAFVLVLLIARHDHTDYLRKTFNGAATGMTTIFLLVSTIFSVQREQSEDIRRMQDRLTTIETKDTDASTD